MKPQPKHLHIIGICGTFMGGVAVLAKQLGFKVTGSDAAVYPPMSTQLETIGIKLMDSFSADNLKPKPDIVVIGNALSRGNVEVEAVLNQRISYTSGAQWLSDNVLQDKWVMAVSGTHGKTTTSAMLAWILADAGIDAGFLIGGVVQNFGVSARLGTMPFFVIEADEYDTAFFDKRSKFVHYHPQSLLIGNLEFDHADIFDSLADIKKQFHHLVRTVPSSGLIIYPDNNSDIKDTLGGWTKTQTIGTDWHYKLSKADGSAFEVWFGDKSVGKVVWDLIGLHNVHNALGAIALAQHAGVSAKYTIESLAKFKTPKRRLELKGEVSGIKVYDDFAHHPTAITTTIAGLKAKVGKRKVIVVLEPRSNTMKSGIHKNKLAESLQLADLVFIYQDELLDWSLEKAMASAKNLVMISNNTEQLINKITAIAQPTDSIVIMSNGGFFDIHQRLLDALQIAKINQRLN